MDVRAEARVLLRAPEWETAADPVRVGYAVSAVLGALDYKGGGRDRVMRLEVTRQGLAVVLAMAPPGGGAAPHSSLKPMLPSEIGSAVERAQVAFEGALRAVASAGAGDDVERLRVQLAGCSVAALGGTADPVVAREGDYGWSVAYQDVLKLRLAYEEQSKDLADVVARLNGAMKELATLRPVE